MNRASIEKLRLDRRLIGRNNWISEKELSRRLEELPDASDKIADEPADAEPATRDSSHTDAPDSAQS